MRSGPRIRRHSNSGTFSASFRQRGWCLVFAIAYFWLCPFEGSLLFAKKTDKVENEPEDVSSYTIKVRRLQKIISRQEDQIEEGRMEERNILEELETLDDRLSRQQEKLAELTTKMSQQEKLIDEEQQALDIIRREKTAVQNHLVKRIKAYYTMGDIGLFNVTFSTQSLPELLSFHDAYSKLLQYDQEVIKTYQVTISDVERAKNALDLEKTVLEDFIQQATTEQKLLKETKEEKNSLLARIRTQTILHQQAMDEMLQTSEKLSASILEIKSKKQLEQNHFLAGKGTMPPPVEGKIITHYQQEKTNKLGISRKSQGIEFAAEDGKNIIAVNDGEVVFSGYLRGYGNTIIIHHGFQYYTVTSRVENILVAKGQRVSKGTVIGTVGAAATLFDEGLYFEIRHGRQSQDPISWLNPKRLTRGAAHSSG